MRLHILMLPGDGIGPEVMSEAERVLRRVASDFGHDLMIEEGVIGGAAMRRGLPAFPDATLAAALRADAVLFGAVGDSAFDSLPPEQRPESGLLRLRKALGVFTNLRPVRAYPALLDASPLKNHLADGVDVVIVRELTGGLYYGSPRGISGEGPDMRAVNTMTYSRAEIERIARVAFQIARRRRRKVTSVDKSNVLETSQLWRAVVELVSREFTDVALEHLLVDNCAMQLVLDPRRFDVLLTENMFGDILSDEAAVIAGSIGMLSSASLGDLRPNGTRIGLYEPIHGSAPDLAGRNVANPLGAIGCTASMLDESFGLREEAAAVMRAIERVVEQGPVTADIGKAGASTTDVGQAVCSAIQGGQQ